MTTYDQWKLASPPEGPPFEHWPLSDRIAYWRDQIEDEKKSLKDAIAKGQPTEFLMKYVDDLCESYESLIAEE